MAGRKKIPTKLHILKGTDRADRRNSSEPEPEACIPDPPPHLSAEALEEWSRITVELDRLGLLTELDRTELAMYCQAYGRWVKYEKIIAEKGELYKTTNGNVQTSPAMWVANKAMEQCHKFLTEFGMTPSSRAKVCAGEGKKKTADPWSAFGG